MIDSISRTRSSNKSRHGLRSVYGLYELRTMELRRPNYLVDSATSALDQSPSLDALLFPDRNWFFVRELAQWNFDATQFN